MADKKTKLEYKATKFIQQHSNVSLHFNADKTLDIEALGATPEQFSGEPSVALRLTPTSLRGW